MSTIVDPRWQRSIYEWACIGGILTYTCFPEKTRGFFYYHNPPDGSEFSAGVHFRICESAAEFEQGRDLLTPKGDVWGPRLLELVQHDRGAGFLSLLRAENLIDDVLIHDINRWAITHHVRHYHASLADPFYLNVAQVRRKIIYATRAGLVSLTLPVALFQAFKKNSYTRPLTGTIKAQFELSDLPEHKALGSTPVIRVLKVVEPIAVDPLSDGTTIPVPVPGTLLYRNAKGRRKGVATVVHIPLKKQQMADDLLALLKTAGPR